MPCPAWGLPTGRVHGFHRLLGVLAVPVSRSTRPKGGQASCTLAIRGKHVQLATASGSFGRATCTGVLPAGESPAG
ncbi:hypothetical protein [Streptomyces sp. NPDC000880]